MFKDLAHYLCSLETPIRSIGTRCPEYDATRCASTFADAIAWIACYKEHIILHLETSRQAQARCKPALHWWLVALAIAPTLGQVRTVSNAIEVPSAICSRSQRRHQLRVLAEALAESSAVECALGRQSRNAELWTAMPSPRTVRVGKFSMSLAKAEEFIKAQSSFCYSLIEDFKDAFEEGEEDGGGGEGGSCSPSLETVLRSVARFLVTLIDSITRISVGYDSRDAVESPPVLMPPPTTLPHHLEALDPLEFASVIDFHMGLLKKACRASEIDELGKQHCDLKTKAQRDPVFKLRLREITDETPFREAWKAVGDEFAMLRRFCGCIAAAWLGHKGEREAQEGSEAAAITTRWAMSDFSLEAGLHAAQYEQVIELSRTS